MGFLDKVKKFFSNAKYVVDDKTLSEYIEKEISSSEKYEYELIGDFCIFPDGNKKRVLILNHKFATSDEDIGKGIVYYCCYGGEDIPYNSISELLDKEFPQRTVYYKIEFLDADSEFLNEFMKCHPELSVEDY